MEITPEEGRVLGCLVEKQLTTPQLYPMTENALLAACNQSTARDPVVSYDVATVRLAVRGLRDKELLRTVHRPGERSDKHLHLMEGALELSPEQVVLLAVLLLRGPQTPGELRARTERMHAFATLDEVTRVLDALADRDEPLVTSLERQAAARRSATPTCSSAPGLRRSRQLRSGSTPATVRRTTSSWPRSPLCAPRWPTCARRSRTSATDEDSGAPSA